MNNTFKLNSGYDIPIIGLGTWRSKPDEVGAAVRHAIEHAGYTHIDGASIYKNESEIGRVYQEVFKTTRREDIFITSKLWNTNHSPDNVAKACRQTLTDLHLEYLDLYLMHWGIAFRPGEDTEPMGKDGRVITEPIAIHETWSAMERLVQEGLVKSIGVANFTMVMLHDLVSSATITPAVNQIELHPYNPQTELVKYCQQSNIAVTAYSPMGSPGTAEAAKPRLSADPTVEQLAAKYHKSTSQVLIRYALDRDTVVIPKSVHPDHIAENIDVFDFVLDKEDIATLSALDRKLRFVDPSTKWGIPYFC